MGVLLIQNSGLNPFESILKNFIVSRQKMVEEATEKALIEERKQREQEKRDALHRDLEHQRRM
jgi:hypothetical protein